MASIYYILAVRLSDGQFQPMAGSFNKMDIIEESWVYMPKSTRFVKTENNRPAILASIERLNNV